MHRLTRQVRFAINSTPDRQLDSPPTNSFGGYPTLTGLGYFFALDVTVRGELQRATNYLINIKDIDAIVRRETVPMMRDAIAAGQFTGGALIVREIFHALQKSFAPIELDAIALNLTPTLALSCRQEELPMIRLSQKFEFAASHRLHNESFSDEENRQRFGKCNNPHGHGHNYELQVTLAGKPDANGVIKSIPEFERIVGDEIIARFDHRNLNVELAEFRELNPTVENIAMVIFRRLKPKLADLQSVTLWETAKTWSEYTEP